jgi:phosphoribosylformylglycinamidine synthase subunit PurQ / glutaminase
VFRNILGVSCELTWHRERELPASTDLVVLPGGFSYGDALRSGSIARFSPIMAAVKSHAENGGLTLGICNGFQILLESGLLPGAMLPNANQKFVCRQVKVRVRSDTTPFTRGMIDKELAIPIAHHEGRFHADEALLDKLEQNKQVVLTYIQDNPNGSIRSIAGIANAQGNVLGMMPHPERASEEVLGSVDGLGFFRSVVASIQAR